MARRRSASPARAKLSIEDEIAHLRGLELAGLRARWQSLMGRPAPLHIPQHLLFGILAYRIQAEALGDLDAETTRLLKKIGSVKSASEIAPLADASDQRRRDLLPGTVLTREWNGRTPLPSPGPNGTARASSVFGTRSPLRCGNDERR